MESAKVAYAIVGNIIKIDDDSYSLGCDNIVGFHTVSSWDIADSMYAWSVEFTSTV